MRKVRFDKPFYTTGGDFVRGDGRKVSGVRYRPGVYVLPDDFPLPKSATILDDHVDQDEPKDEPGRAKLSDFDMERSASDAFIEVSEQAEQNYQENVQKKKGK